MNKLIQDLDTLELIEHGIYKRILKLKKFNSPDHKMELIKLESLHIDVENKIDMIIYKMEQKEKADKNPWLKK